MNRRELLKSSLFLAGSFGTLNLSACSAKKDKTDFNRSDILNKNLNNSKKFNITSPLPLNTQLIDELEDLNSKYKKSKITSLYNSLPFPLAVNLEGFHSRRGKNEKIKTIDDFLHFVNYAKNKGFDFTYTLNSPRPILENDFKKNSKNLFNLLDELKRADVKKIKVSNSQLLKILSEKYPNFELQASTSFEFHNLSQYVNLLKNYPNIKLIDIAIDENRNFEFLKNLKKIFPKVQLEIMVNEPCLRGCPSRIAHCASNFCEFDCMKIINKDWVEEFAKSGVIYPWNLAVYQNAGIDKFKFIASGQTRADIKNLDYLKYYLDMVENLKEIISKTTSKIFFEKILKSWHEDNKIKDIQLSKLIPLMPDINYFLENGSKCASDCGIDCNYCIECAKKMKKVLS